jgi:8-oxo-dGTP pyrophosphatase MutT (NUDIX family)
MKNFILDTFLAAATFMNGAKTTVRSDADPQHEVSVPVDEHPEHDLDDIEHAAGAKHAFDAKEAKKRLADLDTQYEDVDGEYTKLFDQLQEGEPTPEQRSKLEFLHTHRSTLHHERSALKKQVAENDFGPRSKRNTPEHELEDSFKNHSQSDEEEEQLKHKAREHLKELQRNSFSAEREKLKRSKKESKEGADETSGEEEGEDASKKPEPGKKDADKKDAPKDKDAKNPAEKKAPAAEGKDAAAKKDPKKKDDAEAPAAGEDESGDEETPIEELEEAIELHAEFMAFITKRFPGLLKDMEKLPLDDLATKESTKKEQSEQAAKQAEEQANMSEEEQAAAMQQQEGAAKAEDKAVDKQHAHEIKLAKIKSKPRADRQNPLADSEGTTNAQGQKVAAGVMFISRHGKVLVGLRAEPGAYHHHWGIFGGHHEHGESLEVTAIREVMEEAGYVISEPQRLQLIATTDDEETSFTYFVYTVDEPFVPRLNHEHTGYEWLAYGELPSNYPLIPGLEDVLNSPVVTMLRKAKMTELDVIRAMAAGKLASPQTFYNMKLYKMRITGTGTSFRHGRLETKDQQGNVILAARKDEFVFRTPEQFLTVEFMERCNGIPVIFDHPEKAILNSKEFHERIVGIMVMPWIEADEVWGIAKIYDDDTKVVLDSKKMSTSPSVVFLDRDSTSTIALNDGSQILVERVPTLLDHLAICDVGVWDKGRDPTGVESQAIVQD